MESLLLLKGLSKTYNPGLGKKKVQALRGVSFSVGQGEVYGLVGPNGAGKSTTIRVLLGLIRPDAGEVLFCGRPLDRDDFHRQLGYLPENPYLYDHLSLSELLSFGARVNGMDTKLARNRGAMLIEKVGLQASAGRPLRSYSKGMLQRAALCLALLADPEVVVLDEPMSGLDPIGRRMVVDVIRELKQAGKTVLFCSHILSDVERLCDRVGLLVSGHLRAEINQQERILGREGAIHLVVEGDADKVGSRLTGQDAQCRKLDSDQLLIGVRPKDLSSTLGQIEAAGARVVATRSGEAPLEELFIETVREAVS